MKTALVLRHVGHEDLGNLEPVLRGQQFTITYKDAATHIFTALDPLQPDLLVVLGGPVSVYDQADFPFLAAEIDIIKQRLQQDLPTIGICLGAQLIAAAAGAAVYPGLEGKEIGWSLLTLTPAGKRSTLAALETTPVLHWHGDTFDLPADATLLASSGLYEHQAFSIGNNILALQFHPEVLAHNMEHWFIGGAGEIAQAKMNLAHLRQDTDKYIHKLQIQAKQLWQAWLLNMTAQ